MSMSPGLAYPVTLTVPKDAAWFSVARLAGAAVAVNSGLSFDAIEDIKIIVTEACTYCVQRDQSGGQLIVSFDTPNNSFVITVEDREFAASDRSTEAGASNASGTIDGLFLIRSLADDVEYRASATGGLVLRVTKDFISSS
jgi:serine/threonine-protein kinase RsbW